MDNPETGNIPRMDNPETGNISRMDNPETGNIYVASLWIVHS
jgi:hypothetical protein